MSLLYLDLQLPNEPKIRAFMVEEIELDRRSERLALHERLNDKGREQWPQLLLEAARERTDAWLANQIRARELLRLYDRSGRRMPINAAETVAEGDFNHYYCRAVCRLAQERGAAVVVYRAKNVAEPRENSELLRGQRLRADEVLLDLRAAVGKTTLVGVPGGPNSGISLSVAS
jgi:hypothetical protein